MSLEEELSCLTRSEISRVSLKQRFSVTARDSVSAQLIAVLPLKGNIWCQKAYLRSCGLTLVISFSASSLFLSALPAYKLMQSKLIHTGYRITRDSSFVSVYSTSAHWGESQTHLAFNAEEMCVFFFSGSNFTLKRPVPKCQYNLKCVK